MTKKEADLPLLKEFADGRSPTIVWWDSKGTEQRMSVVRMQRTLRLLLNTWEPKADCNLTHHDVDKARQALVRLAEEKK